MPQWKQYSGNWTVTQQMQARGGDEWPTPPGAPTIGTATAGNTQATVAFTAPANLGIPATITQYTVTSSPGGITATGSASPIVVTGLSNGTAYTFTVTATNATGTGPASAASNAVTPEPNYELYTWGANGDGMLMQNNTIFRSSPVQVGSAGTWSSKLTNNVDVSFAIKKDGTLWAAGISSNGILGTGNTTSQSSPVQVGALTDWKKVATGGSTSVTLAIRNNGSLYAWGYNFYGSVGDNTRVDKSSPVQIGSSTWSDMAISDVASVCAIQTDGTIWSWGEDGFGTLGQNTNGVNRSSPTQIGALTNWASVQADSGSFIAIKTDGTMWAWGRNNSGELGLNNTVTASSPVQVGSLTTWKNAGTIYYAKIAVKTDGTMWSWGTNSDGRLGLGDNVTRSSPVQIGALTTWDRGGGGNGIGMAIKTDGTLWTWGSNASGGQGRNTSYLTNTNSPNQVGSKTTWVANSIEKLGVGTDSKMATTTA